MSDRQAPRRLHDLDATPLPAHAVRQLLAILAPSGGAHV